MYYTTRKNNGFLELLLHIIATLVGEILRALISAAVLGMGFHLFYDHYFSWNFNLPPLGIPCAFWGAFSLMYVIIVAAKLLTLHKRE